MTRLDQWIDEHMDVDETYAFHPNELSFSLGSDPDGDYAAITRKKCRQKYKDEVNEKELQKFTDQAIKLIDESVKSKVGKL